MRGALLSKRARLLIGRSAQGEEEKVEVKVQEEEVEDRETHGREQSEDRRERTKNHSSA